MTTADRELRELTDRLGLADYRQDWGNADASRVREFIDVCRAGNLTPPQQYAMGELVLASMNEAPWPTGRPTRTSSGSSGSS